MSIRKDKQKVRRFYVPESWESTLDDLEEILNREGSNLSKWIRENADRYVMLHKPGNPQTRLDVTMKLGQSYRANGCLDCGGKPFYQVTINGVKAFMCRTHFEIARNHGRIQGWKRLEGSGDS